MLAHQPIARGCASPPSTSGRGASLLPPPSFLRHAQYQHQRRHQQRLQPPPAAAAALLLSVAHGAHPCSNACVPRGRRGRRASGWPRVAAASAAAGAPAGGSGESGGAQTWAKTILLGALFAAWYAANIQFNLYNKAVLKAFPHPLTCTTVQFVVGALLALLFWASGAVKRPTLSMRTVRSVLPLAAVHVMGNLLTNVSLGAVAVSFTHTIKAMEPAFSVALSAIFLGEQPHPLILLTLLPIMGGVALASFSEASFNWLGFLSAMGSNLTFQSRNVLSKVLMGKERHTGPAQRHRDQPQGQQWAGGEGGLGQEGSDQQQQQQQQQQQLGAEADDGRQGTGQQGGEQGKGQGGQLDNFNLFGIITLLSAVLLLPVTLLVEGWRLTPGNMAAMGIVSPNEVIKGVLISGVLFHLYQQVSYMILERVSPVTHSIGNCVKRVAVIVVSVIVFRNPMPIQSVIGTAVALAGVFAYSQIKRTVGGQKAKAV